MLNHLQIPVLQAPMVGVSSPALAATVSNAGGLGAVAIGAMAPDAIGPMVDAVKALTANPFSINMFVQRHEAIDEDAIQHSIARLCQWRERFGLPPEQKRPANWYADFQAQLEAVIACAPAVVSFTFGCLEKAEVEKLHAAHIYVIGTATTPDEAKQWQAVGADAICIQAIEAGGHRGSFTAEAQLSGMPMQVLLAEVKKAVTLPLIAAGGIMDGKGIAAVLKAGAIAAQLGTAFLLCPESITSLPWRQEIKGSGATRLTRVFSGRYARGIINDFMQEMADIEKDLPAYPVQNVLTGELRAACAKAGAPDCLSLWAGTNYKMTREMPAGELVRLLWQEAQGA